MIGSLHVQSEAFGAMGNLAGEGLLNPLGRPAIDPMTIMLREAVQNSWDAHIGATIRFALDGYAVTRRSEIVRRFFSDLPPGASEDTLPLYEVVRTGGPAWVLALSDRGTKGLGGPTRADEMTADNAPRDFVDFLRNVGEPPDRRVSTGGTYGYGKAALYLAAETQTLAVYTRTRHAGSLESRFIISCVGPRYAIRTGPDLGRYTGRHWWGERRGGIVEPLLNAEADEAAELLGLPGFDRVETGTTIGVINPKFDGGFGLGAMAFLVEGFLWYFWPKMLPGSDGRPAIDFTASWEGSPLIVPAPEAFPPLDLYVAAYKAAKNYAGEVPVGDTRAREVTYWRNRVALIAAQMGPIRPRGRISGAQIKFPRPVAGPPDFSSPSHHFALMRTPELVVRYVPALELSTDVMEYGGVVIADRHYDRHYADSEPPAHDDWVVDNLDGGEAKGVVRAVFKAVREVGQSYRGEASDHGTSEPQAPVGEFTNFLGAALLGADGDRPGEIEHEKSRGTTTGPGARITTGRPEFGGEGGRPVVILPFVIKHKKGTLGSLVTARAAAVLDDGSFESDVPAGAVQPEVLGWRTPSGEFIAGEVVQIDAGIDGDDWAVVGTVSPDLATGLELTAVPLEGGKR